ncbi:uncharacterized protein EV420DRAFT_1521198 [Desarmillaria tabescens]|uniref:Uncharacterized protein n=1 Tax=Armillaria tabescens TaxID=1929756 RepID=A0AA39NBZ5_ARMTA|nr:uncharacterized protein EV420DRAFT_1521198 [Desarmillaria tabescens]KAK0462832.1 hypothetical protein EV420DRAFT_1521198 [Desarmillaria tabescens]
MHDLASNPFFILAVLAPPPPDCAINAVRNAYCTVFGRDAPPEEWDNQLLLWIRVCSAVGADHHLVKGIRRFYPSLPDPSQWDVVGHLLDLPLALQENKVTASKTIGVFEFMRRLQSEVELPEPYPGDTAENSNAILHRREQLVTAICHTLLSFVGFNVTPEHKTSTNKLKLSKDATKCSRYLPYSIEPLEFDFVVQIMRGKVPDSLALTVPNVCTSISWRHGSMDQANQVVSWGFNSAYFLDEHVAFLSQFDKIEDTGFKSATRFMKFVQMMHENLLKPLWENIQENYPDVGSTDPPPEPSSHQESLEETNLEMDLREE